MCICICIYIYIFFPIYQFKKNNSIVYILLLSFYYIQDICKNLFMILEYKSLKDYNAISKTISSLDGEKEQSINYIKLCAVKGCLKKYY